MNKREEDVKLTVTSPVGTVLFSHIKVPQVNEKFGGDPKYSISLAFNPVEYKSHKEFIDYLKELEVLVAEDAGVKVNFSPIRPRMIKNKATKELEEHATDVMVTFKSKHQPTAFEGSLKDSGDEVTGEGLQLPFGSTVDVAATALPVDFKPGDKRMVGLSLQLNTVGIVERSTKRENIFARKAKGE